MHGSVRECVSREVGRYELPSLIAMYSSHVKHGPRLDAPDLLLHPSGGRPLRRYMVQEKVRKKDLLSYC